MSVSVDGGSVFAQGGSYTFVSAGTGDHLIAVPSDCASTHTVHDIQQSALRNSHDRYM